MTMKEKNTSGYVNKKYTLDAYVYGEPNREAYEMISNIAKGKMNEAAVIYLYGPIGLGKTHLLHGLINHMMNQENKRIQYIHCDSPKIYKVVSRLNEVDMFLMDDIDQLKGDHAQLMYMLDYLKKFAENQKTIIITGNVHPDMLSNLLNPVREFLKQGNLIVIGQPTIEMAKEILNLRLIMDGMFGINISEEALQLIAVNGCENVRILEGMLNKVCLFAHLQEHKVVDEEFVKKILAD